MELNTMEKKSIFFIIAEKEGKFQYQHEVIIKALFSSSDCLLSKATEKIIFYVNSFDYHLKPQLPGNKKEANSESISGSR